MPNLFLQERIAAISEVTTIPDGPKPGRTENLHPPIIYAERINATAPMILFGCG
jgi:hypothetical protein